MNGILNGCKFFRAFIFFISMVLFGYASCVQALCRVKDVPGPQTISFSGPDLSIPRDAPNGTVLYTSSAQTVKYSEFLCTTSERRGVVVDPSRGTQSAWSNEFPLGVSGLVVKFIETTEGKYLSGTVMSEAGEFSIGGQYRMQIIKSGDLSSSSIIKAGALGAYVFGTAVPMSFTLKNPINIVAASCDSPDVIVAMGDYTSSDFNYQGGTTKPVGFAIKLNGCPANLITKVNYTIAATTPQVNASEGIVSLNASSTAKGIGLQIYDGDGKPMPLNTVQNFTAYDKRGGSFQIPMSASYYHLPSESFKPGTANTEVTFSMSYL
jgi:major type 1 subunit fimbrin (pilin)